MTTFAKTAPITVAAVRAALENYPPHMLVVVDGYELGYDNPRITMAWARIDGGYLTDNILGAHDDTHSGDAKGTQVVLFSREARQ